MKVRLIIQIFSSLVLSSHSKLGFLGYVPGGELLVRIIAFPL